jgi:hypothetical protein
MSHTPINYHSIPVPKGSVVREEHDVYGLPGKRKQVKCDCSLNVYNCATLVQNYRDKFEFLKRGSLSNSEFAHLPDAIVTAGVNWSKCETISSKRTCWSENFVRSNDYKWFIQGFVYLNTIVSIYRYNYTNPLRFILIVRQMLHNSSTLRT